MRKYLVILSKEAGYGERLCRALGAKNSLQLSPQCFHEGEEAVAFCRSHPAAVVLADEFFEAEGILSGLAGHPCTVSLCEDPETGRLPGKVYRYQSVEEILRKLSQCCEEASVPGLMGTGGRSVRLIAVYSPSLPSVKTAFALTLAALEKRSRKTLYLNLEEFGGTATLLRGGGEKTLSDAIYWLKQDALDQGKLQVLISSTGSVDYIPPMPFADDVKEAGGEEWVRLIDRIAQVTEYEEIVVDLPQSLYVAQDVIDVCDELFLPTGGDSISEARMRELERYMERPEHRQMKEKARKVRIEGASFPKADGNSDFAEELMYGKFGEELLKEVSGDRE